MFSFEMAPIKQAKQTRSLRRPTPCSLARILCTFPILYQFCARSLRSSLPLLLLIRALFLTPLIFPLWPPILGWKLKKYGKHRSKLMYSTTRRVQECFPFASTIYCSSIPQYTIIRIYYSSVKCGFIWYIHFT